MSRFGLGLSSEKLPKISFLERWLKLFVRGSIQSIFYHENGKGIFS